MSYPDKINLIEKHVSVPFELQKQKHWVSDKVFITDTMSEAHAFEKAATRIGFNPLDAGKVMGLAPYGKQQTDVPKIIKDGFLNKEVFGPSNKFAIEYGVNFPFEDNFESKANFAYSLQKEIQDSVAENILYAINKTGKKNVCLSGGFFLNCTSNYNLLKKLPKVAYKPPPLGRELKKN
jgi:carbamoyltransferase